MASSKSQKSEGGKPDSFDSRISALDEALHALCEAVLVEAPNKRRARVLAILGALGHDGTAMFTESELSGT